jgi:hypothetical protein
VGVRPAVSTWLAESYSPGIRREDVAAAERRAASAVAALRGEGVAVAYLGALLVAGDEVVFHVFEADEASSVAEAVGRAQIEVARVVEAESVPWAGDQDVVSGLLRRPSRP